MNYRQLLLLCFGLWMSVSFLSAEEKGGVLSKDTIKTFTMDEVVITSSTKETNDLRLLPGSVSLLSPQDINARQIDALKDISVYVPNLYMPDYGARLTSAIYIRGIGARSSGQSIGLYVDNIPYLDKSAFDFEFNDIQRIEVLRGPQGTLYGRNSMGGIINVYTLSPLNYQGTKIYLSGGNYGTFKAKASHYTKIGERFGISAGAYYDRNDGFFMNEYKNKKADREESAGGHLKMDWQITDQLRAQYTFNLDYVDQGAFPYGQYDAETGKVQPIRINDPSSYWRRIFNNSLYLEWVNKQIILSSTTTYQNLRDDMKMDQDYTEKSIFTLNQKQSQYAWTQEVAVKSNTKNPFQWSAGAFGFYNSLHTDGPVIFKEDGIESILQNVFNGIVADNPNAPHLTVYGDGQNQIYFPGSFSTPTYGFAAFMQGTYNDLIIPGLSATAGIRLDYEKERMNYHSAVDSMKIGMQMGPIQMMIPVETQLTGKTSQHFLQALPKASLRYQCLPGTFTYFSVAKGYKTGGYNVQMFGDLVQAQAQYDLMSKFAPDKAKEPIAVEEAAAYKPEHSWCYELGIRSELIKNRLDGEFTLFYMDIKDLQLTTFAENGSGRMITNGGKARNWGAEVSLRGLITKGLTAEINYGYTRATFHDYLYTAKDGTAYDCKNNYIPYTPRHTLSVGAQYTKLLRCPLMDQFFATLQFVGVGSIFWTELNDLKQPFYGTLNGKVGVRKGIVRVNLWSRNITNTSYQAFYFESFNNAFIQKGKPFQIGGEVSVVF